MISSIRLVKAEEGNFILKYRGRLDKTVGSEYSTQVTFSKDEHCGKWIASIAAGGVPLEKTPEAAADQLSAYLLAMSEAVKSKNIKHINMNNMFDAVSPTSLDEDLRVTTLGEIRGKPRKP
jgi:hypothetical protein